MAKRFAILLVPAYKVSKAAVNMLRVQYTQEFITISPGVSSKCSPQNVKSPALVRFVQLYKYWRVFLLRD